MSESWGYDKKKRRDSNGRRWHFASRWFNERGVPYDENAYELLFRDDEWNEVGRIRFEKQKDNPYRSYESLITKIINDGEFRNSLLDPSSRKLWSKSWK